MRDDQGNTFTEQGGIWVLELKKFNADKIESEDQDYLRQQSTIQHELDSANKSAAELKAKAAELEARLNEAAIREVEANARESEANISKELALKEAQAASLEIERLKSLLSKNDQ